MGKMATVVEDRCLMYLGSSAEERLTSPYWCMKAGSDEDCRM